MLLSIFTNMWDIISGWLNQLLKGIGITLLLSLAGTIVGLFLSFILVALRMQKIQKNDKKIVIFFKKVGQAFAKTYVTVVRGTPMIVQAMIIYYGVNRLFNGNFSLPPLTAGLITVSLNTTAYLAEVVRGGIQSIDKGQEEAARSLGLSKGQTLRYIIFPQAIKNSFPSIGNEFIVNVKDTSILSVIQVVDLYRVAYKAGAANSTQFEAMLVAAFIYLILTYTTSKILIMIEKRMNMEVKELPSSN